MNELNSLRRDFLRAGGFGVAGAALPALSFAAAKSKTPAGQSGMFDVHQLRGHGRRQNSSTPPPSIAPSKPQPRRAEAWFCFLPEPTCASRFISRATFICISSRARPSWPQTRPKPGETTGYNGGTYDAAEPNTPLGGLSGLRP